MLRRGKLPAFEVLDVGSMLLRGALELKHRQVLSTLVKADLQAESCTRLSFYEGARLRARRRPWPVWPRLQTRQSIGWPASNVDLMRPRTIQTRVRSMLVVPREADSQLITERFAAKRDERQAAEQFLHRAYGSLNNSDAAVLADRAKAWPQALAPAPILETVAPELRTFVADKVPRPCSTRGLCASKKRPNSLGSRLLTE